MSDLEDISKVAHVESTDGFMNFSLLTEGAELPANVRMKASGDKQSGKTSLTSSIDPGTLGRRSNASDVEMMPANFVLPIHGLGASGAFDPSGKQLTITEGRHLNDSDEYSAVVGKGLAEKNDLSIGSTFMAYDRTFTVVGIMDLGTTFDNDRIVLPLATIQSLTGYTAEVSSIIVQVDSIENLEAVIADIKESLGEDKVDVSSPQENIREAIESLKSVQNISIIGFVSALTAAGCIVLMVMFVIVRERRREIGVLKAIGGSNRSIVSQFVVEAVVLVAIGGVVGLGTAFVGSGAIANALVSSNATTSTSQPESGPSGPMIRQGDVQSPKASMHMDADDGFGNTSELVGEVTTSIGLTTLLYGFLGMIAVAIAGSAIPAWLIAKVRPAEVLRGE
jgi:putative ABC transport system permease protein